MVDIIELESKNIYKNYIGKKPFIIKNATTINRACNKWSPSYIGSLAPDLVLPLKIYQEDYTVKLINKTFKDYCEYLDKKKLKSFYNEPIMYCHDVPMFSMIRSLIGDIDPHFLAILPSWYHHKWWRYAQFFIGPKGSYTPLHFDCLLTHNIFFQIKGKKKFLLIDSRYKEKLDRMGWRWFKYDIKNMSDSEFLNSKEGIKKEVVTLEKGDMLYMPPGMLHMAFSLEETISFNIDFHTKKSACIGSLAIFSGMPLRNFYYNIILLLGLVFKIPAAVLFPFYKSYLNYVS